METILLLAVVGTLNMACFFIGAKVGNAVARGEEIKAPEIKSPMRLYEEHLDREEAKRENNKLDIILQNIERYDGTSRGQEDVPR